MDAHSRLEVSDPQLYGLCPSERNDVLDDRQGCRHRVTTRRFLCLGIAEVDHRTVTLELGDDTAVGGHDGRHPVLVRVEDLVPILRIQ
jgi:hypothetical protein